MSENLSDFLIDLGSDPDRMARFTVDPTAALNGSSLSIEERTAVMAADSGGVRRMLDAAVAGARNGTKKYGGKRNGGKRNGGKRNGGKRNGGKRNGGKRNGGKRNGGKQKAYRKGSKKK
jgi:hypothetical protein